MGHIKTRICLPQIIDCPDKKASQGEHERAQAYLKGNQNPPHAPLRACVGRTQQVLQTATASRNRRAHSEKHHGDKRDQANEKKCPVTQPHIRSHGDK
jgi:hypothetical protein